MIPARIRQMASATALVGVVGFFCFMRAELGAAVAFSATVVWMLGNLLVWAVLMKLVLKPASENPDVVIASAAIFGKLVLLGGGMVALHMFAPYSRMQVYAIVAGVSSVLLVAFLKAAGSKVFEMMNTGAPKSKAEAAKV